MSSVAKNRPYIAVDWADYWFRAALMAPDGEILDELANDRGIMSFKKGEFAPYLMATCAPFTQQGGHLFLLSGMVGSQRGLAEVPLSPCPANAASLAAGVAWVVRDRVAIIPGVRSEDDDVMRGPEMQVLGAASALDGADALIVLPDKHSKWVSYENGAITGFNTFMTGEFYDLLRQHSTLATLVDSQAAFDEAAFVTGIDYATTSESLLQTAYTVQTRLQLSQMAAGEAESYLMGLVIGEELVSMQLDPGTTLVVVGAQSITERYRIALAHLDVQARILGTQTAWAGHQSVYAHLAQ